jgi:prepilin-type N-terminal cleavage/methylation domain-containing protein
MKARFLQRSWKRGFTLIELMIAIAIGVFVVGAIFRVFTQQTKQLVYQDLQMEMHQNMRMALDVVSRTARMGGFGTGGQTWGALGYTGGGGDVSAELPASISYDGTGPNGSDAITIVTMDSGMTMSTNPASPPSCDTTELEFEPSVFNNDKKLAQLSAGELIMCLDYTPIDGYKSYLWQISGVDSSTGIVSVAQNSGTYTDYDSQCTDNLPLVMVCSRAEVATFYIDADDSDGVGAGSKSHPVLMMDLDFEAPDDDDVPLVDNIEDMQIKYCLRSTVGSTSCDTESAWVDTIDDYSGGDSSSNPDDVYMIRFSFVVRSSREDPQNLFAGQRPEFGNNPASSETDSYFRITNSTEVTVRNMRLLNLP